ncbi:unnamed protein product [Rotaria sp. Silwood1]|nr:unnamed protein product [Rotaria sp. Silwood1]
MRREQGEEEEEEEEEFAMATKRVKSNKSALTALRAVSRLNNILVIEVPIRNPEAEGRLTEAKKEDQCLAQFGHYCDPFFDYIGFLSGFDFQPRIVDEGNNQKQLEMSIGMKNYTPEKIKVSMKNNELIVQGEH